MKHIAKLTLLVAALGSFNRASAFVVVDDNSELFVTAGAAVQFDDNIYLDPTNEKNDTIFSFTPGVDFVFGKNAATSGNVFFREEFRRYSDNDNQNTELANFGAQSTYSNDVTKLELNASYAELAQNDNNVNPLGDIAHREVTTLGGRSEFGVTAKAKLSVGLTYNNTDYKSNAYTDSAITSVPLDVYVAVSPKLDWSLGYQYRKSDLSGAAIDTQDNFFNLGARGEFTPKLSGQVRLGYTQRSFDKGADEDLFGMGAKVTYAYSDKTSYSFTLDNDFGSAGNGASTKNFSWGLNGSSYLTDQWYVTAGFTYRQIEYPKATDDYTEGTVSATYEYSKMVNFSGSVVIRNNSSDLVGGDFAGTVFSIGANFRY